ncbi:MAG: PKD domain-containing protein, partial [Psychroserpens sp.]|nr:PKD domain-containing protein [Psychroserpens sp.]
MQAGTFNRCEPDIFYDSGGPAGNYGNDENIVTTICPENAGDFISLNFNTFSTQLNVDILTIYDGPDALSPIVGTFSGVAGPGIVTASAANTSGCITLEFISNGSGTTTGWEALITCFEQCQTITTSIITDPVPNGSGVIEIPPNTTVDFIGSATFSDDGTGATYNWNFGDTNTATGTDVSNTFVNPGTYNVTFTVTDTNPTGCSDT